MNQNKIDQALKVSQLFKKYLKEETLTAQERHELFQWLDAHPKERKNLQQLLSQKLNEQKVGDAKVYDPVLPYAELTSRIAEDRPHPKIKSLYPFYKIAAAAAIIVVLSVGLLLFNQKDQQKPAIAVANTTKTVELTLAGGKKINLESHQDGVIAFADGATIKKENPALLSYQATGATEDVEGNLNTLAVPAGKQYQLILPDGSKVWLNAMSKISFPSNFNKGERIVEVEGEAYFEVNHFANWPFRVKTAHQLVEVLGTKFNVQAYPDESQTATTLVNGSVRVSDQSSSQLLKPGQIAIKSNQMAGYKIADADLNQAIAWKNGQLVFKDDKIEELTRTLSRTFDVEFQIDERIKGQHFSGTFAIKSGVEHTLRTLEQTGAIHFSIKGRRVSVTP